MICVVFGFLSVKNPWSSGSREPLFALLLGIFPKMCASEFIVDMFSNDSFGYREPFRLEILGLASRTAGAGLRT